ncbi:MAG: SDR family oxidoreductase [Hyphomicrobiaceae bacterium]
MKRVLVIGASKGIGREVVHQALDAGYSVRAMARNADALQLSVENLEKFSGDARDVGDVQAALANVDVVVQALGIPLNLDMFTKPVTLFSEATKVLVPAMEAAGVERLICVTGYGAGDSRQSINCLQRLPFKLLLANAYDDKSIQEDLITQSKLDWTIVRPGVLTNQGKSGTYKVLSESRKWRNGIISRADVADFIVAQIDRNTMSRKKPVLIRLPL